MAQGLHACRAALKYSQRGLTLIREACAIVWHRVEAAALTRAVGSSTLPVKHDKGARLAHPGCEDMSIIEESKNMAFKHWLTRSGAPLFSALTIGDACHLLDLQLILNAENSTKYIELVQVLRSRVKYAAGLHKMAYTPKKTSQQRCCSMVNRFTAEPRLIKSKL
eukprot:scaffold177677_cov19-Tisochrysis_lutea.AAC.2